MQKEDFNSIFPMKDLSLMGIFEILPKIFKLKKRIEETIKKIEEIKPDLILTIDSPGFCFRVMEQLKSTNIDLFKNIKKVHLIAPSVWAYKEKRAKKISKIYDLLLCILPFEPPYFEKYGLKTEFIGHPIFDEDMKLKTKYTKSDLIKLYPIARDDIIVILTPGSRESEVERIYPIMIKTINILKERYSYTYKDYHIFTFANNYTKELVDFTAHEHEFDTRIITNENEKEKILSCANVALAKSGTNTFEFNIFGVPLIITYTFNWFTNKIAKIIIKIKYANLVNILANKEIIPEFVLDNVDPSIMADRLNKLLKNKQLAKKQVEDTKNMIKELGFESEEKASECGAKKIINLLLEKVVNEKDKKVDEIKKSKKIEKDKK